MGSEGMVCEERENNGGGAEHGGGSVECSGDAVNGFAMEIENGVVGDGNSAGSSFDGLRTYKRRRHAKMVSSETKLHKSGKVAADSVTQLPDKTISEPMQMVQHNSSFEHVNHPLRDSHAVMSGLDDCPLERWRKIVLEQMYQSLNESKGGLEGCIQEAILFHPESGCRTAAKGSVHSCDNNLKGPLQTGRMNGTYNASKGKGGVASNGSLSESNNTNADLCRRAFVGIIMSEKFAQLGGMLLENFPGIKVDSFLGIDILNGRMKEGAYERTPMLFNSDMQQLWTKLQKVGAEMAALAKSLSEKSRICFREQFHTGESNLHTKLEQTEARGIHKVCACKCCGEKADGRDCLVCDSCEEIYHVSCIGLAIEEIPLKSWYCANCTANGIESPHDGCVVCEKLNASRPPNNEVEDDPTREETFAELEENSNGLLEQGFQLVKGGKNLPCCNVCQSEVDDSENFRVCSHSLCPHKYYHVRCLTNRQLREYGPCWYCPSCLCRTCLTDRDDEKIVLCDACDHAYHIYCMQPPRTSIPRGKWFCAKCNSGIQQIRKAKRAYESFQRKLKKRSENELVEDGGGEELVGKSGGGVDMLLSAAKTLNYAEKMAAAGEMNG